MAAAASDLALDDGAEGVVVEAVRDLVGADGDGGGAGLVVVDAEDLVRRRLPRASTGEPDLYHPGLFM